MNWGSLMRARIRARKLEWSRFTCILGRCLIRCLLAPVALLLGWGPITHIYLGKRALDRVSPDSTNDDGVREVLESRELRTQFVDAGNSVDLIKAIDLRTGEKLFDYAHNNIPNYFTGDPSMGRFLLQEVRRSGDDPIRRAWALGWLAHQVSDSFAHKIPFAGCEGWANSRRMLAGLYRPNVEGEPPEVTHARIQLFMADHLLAEMLVDCLCYMREREYIDEMEIDLDVPTNGEVIRASTRILKGFLLDLGTGVVYFEPLTEGKLLAIRDYCHLAILCLLDVYRAILNAYPGDDFEKYFSSSPRMDRLDEILENSIEAIAHVLRFPDNPWEPRRWLPGDSVNFEHSMYDYDGIWRPEMYNFVRKKESTIGVAGGVGGVGGGLVDKLVTFARDFANRHDTWPWIRLGMATVYGRGRGQWPMVSVFLRTLVNRHPENIQKTTELVANMRNMPWYEEVTPD